MRIIMFNTSALFEEHQIAQDQVNPCCVTLRRMPAEHPMSRGADGAAFQHVLRGYMWHVCDGQRA